jgi:hypothetical protein
MNLLCLYKICLTSRMIDRCLFFTSFQSRSVLIALYCYLGSSECHGFSQLMTWKLPEVAVAGEAALIAVEETQVLIVEARDIKIHHRTTLAHTMGQTRTTGVTVAVATLHTLTRRSLPAPPHTSLSRATVVMVVAEGDHQPTTGTISTVRLAEDRP